MFTKFTLEKNKYIQKWSPLLKWKRFDKRKKENKEVLMFKSTFSKVAMHKVSTGFFVYPY